MTAFEQITTILTNLKDEIKELKELRDSTKNIEFKEDYQRKVTEKVNEYNSIIKSI